MRVRAPLAGLDARVLFGLYAALALAPLAIAWALGLPRRPWADELSSALALVGFSTMLMEFVLCGRFDSVSGRIGIDRTMRAHQLIARALTVAILLHPFLYTLSAQPARPWDPEGARALAIGGASAVTGMLAWVMLPVLVVWSIFRDAFPYRYETWRLAHGFGAALIAVFGAYHAIVAGRYSEHPVLAWFWIALVAVAMLTLVRTYLLEPLRQRRHRYRVVSVRPVAHRTWEMAIEPERRETFVFRPGQFVWLTLGRTPFSVTEHPFSICSAPAELPRVAFAIKEAGDFTSRLGELKPGAEAFIDGPHGNMVVHGRAAAGIAFVAGGVGFAPIASMLRQLRADGDPRPMKLIYGNRIEAQIMYRDEIEAAAHELDLQVHHVLGEPPPGWQAEVGRLDAPLLRRLLGPAPPRDWLYVVCGPTPMILAVQQSLAELGVPEARVVAERFSYD
ncbi:MAG: ferredoxin reductase family protein [Burkholderiales bacterium]|nr:MAG: ferredoxin reductase family protein [Burkholderiales bacterium]